MALRMIAAAGLLTLVTGFGGASSPQASGEFHVPKEMAVSFLEAVISESGKPFVAECVAEAGDAKDDLHDALDNLKKALQNKDLDDVSEALRNLADMLDEAPDALALCKKGAASARETARHLKELLHEGPFKTMWQHAVDDHARITSELDAGIAAYASKNYTASGQQLGQALRHVIVSETHDLAALNVNVTKLEALLFFVNGFLNGDDGSLAFVCMLHLYNDGVQVRNATEMLLAALHDRDLAQMSDALKAIAKVLDTIEPDTKAGCSEYSRVSRETIKALEELRTQGHITKAVEGHLLADHKNITGELDLFLGGSGAKDTFGAAAHFGKLLRLLLLGELSVPAPAIVV